MLLLSVQTTIARKINTKSEYVEKKKAAHLSQISNRWDPTVPYLDPYFGSAAGFAAAYNVRSLVFVFSEFAADGAVAHH
jgi:hypothetical protein